MARIDRWLLGLYAAWTAFVLLVTFMRDGLSPDNVTRVIVLVWLAMGLAWARVRRVRPSTHMRARFVLTCALSALVVEAAYMVSRPVFASLRVVRGTAMDAAVRNTLIDWAFTFPAYIVIFSAVWMFIARFRYRVSEYVLLFSLAQALGDGSAFFAANPAMLLFAPYVMLNYQAANVVPYLRVREQLMPSEAHGVRHHALRLLLPLVIIPAVYWVMGALIIVVGRAVGLA